MDSTLFTLWFAQTLLNLQEDTRAFKRYRQRAYESAPERKVSKKKYDQARWSENSEQLSLRNEAWCARNKERRRLWRNDRNRQRWQTDFSFRLLSNLRRRINN